MAHQYLTEAVNTKQTPQSEPIPGAGQVANSAGGHAWELDDLARLRRFLILGSEGGSYYASERELTKQNVDALLRCMAADGLRAVREIVQVSTEGRAPKNDMALFALALASKYGDDATRSAAYDALPKVARIGTHLFQFMEFRQAFGGWGRGMRRAVGRWYTDVDVDLLAYQLVKYRQRDGWTHRDALRLAHPTTDDPARNALFSWVVSGEGENVHELVEAFRMLQACTDPLEAAHIIAAHRMPREAVPTELLNEPVVWEALLEDMPMTAMIRNLATMTRIGVVAPFSAGTGRVLAQLADAERIRKARVHPIAVLFALRTYASGHGVRGGHSWTPVPQIIDALDAAFYHSFGNVRASGKRTMLALDVSGSMTMGMVAGVPGLTPRDASAAMALITAATEQEFLVCGFSTQFVQLNITPRQRLDDVIRTVSDLPFAGTDCAVPMLAALHNKLDIESFVVYTDSETWAGHIHPSQALTKFRQETGVPATLVVVGMVSNGFSIADPRDRGMLDVVGFDTAAPQLISDFAAGAV